MKKSDKNLAKTPQNWQFRGAQQCKKNILFDGDWI